MAEPIETTQSGLAFEALLDSLYDTVLHSDEWSALLHRDPAVKRARSMAQQRERLRAGLIAPKRRQAQQQHMTVMRQVVESLKLLNVEGGVGWLAHLVPWMDVLYEEHRRLYEDLPRKPSDYYYEHVCGSFIWDSLADTGAMHRLGGDPAHSVI